MLSIRPFSSLLRHSKQLIPPKFVPVASFAARPAPTPAANTKQVEYRCGNDVFVGSGKLGDTILDVVFDNDIPLDGFGACGGNLACCTSHIILSPEHYKRVDRISPPSQEEMDLLDEAPEFSEYSRLACQVQLGKNDPDIISVKVPVEKRDMRVMT
ncbi:hypothetical protein OESDEN_15352 [Oesophagostomum dentatum]|uniref:2Fe-2S iron-sulfur cluster binding domain protein n=1 Tax=Oesophagostomum dentatum TaxID=61180 RepID=A0A0B1SHV9_OESDE|nr:hypothetical protein OESDEN_15352 [Oesophagostomum dentatum]